MLHAKVGHDPVVFRVGVALHVLLVRWCSRPIEPVKVECLITSAGLLLKCTRTGHGGGCREEWHGVVGRTTGYHHICTDLFRRIHEHSTTITNAMVGRSTWHSHANGTKHGGPSYRIARAVHVAHADPMPPEVDIPLEAAPALDTKLGGHVSCASQVAVVVAHLGCEIDESKRCRRRTRRLQMHYMITVLIVQQ